MKRKTAGMITCLMAVSLILGGCQGNPTSNEATGNETEQTSPVEEETSAGKEGTKLVIGVESGSPQIAFYEEQCGEFEEETGIEIEWVEIPHDNMHERFVQEAISKSGAIDIYDADQPWISEFASKGYLEVLGDKLTEEDKADFYEAALDASSYNGEIYSIPFFVHTPIVFYRTDLFEDAGIKEFPKTWEEYADAAKKLTYGEVYGTIIEAKQAVEPVTHLVDWIYQAGGSIIDAEGNISIHSPENKQVFEYLLKMMYEDESVMPGSIGYDNADVHNLFMQGKVAMVKNWPYMYSMAKDPEQSTVSDSFAVAVQPAGKEQASSAWTWGFGISSSSKNKEAAWEFIKWATSSEKLAELGISSCNPVPRTSSLNAVQEDISLSDFDKESIQTMCDALNYASNATENPNFPTVQNELSYTLSNIMSRQVEIEEGLEQAEETIKEAIE
ncbi:sugar ABC transporter substrate-binding protein [Lachnospiraceae bacterium]|jgi:multiple sugar transport system substrate-binding protein|nr:sugar ABC transporter substrate-binding protein [uncultured Schaedlerella sp.]MCI9154346.1 sugar ABC transporter substrate-binding protein [Ruminococcus sp.]NBI59644.1 sugar ABC transporter substrate-binding protein [Lachnospiraceae bacterium]